MEQRTCAVAREISGAEQASAGCEVPTACLHGSVPAMRAGGGRAAGAKEGVQEGPLWRWAVGSQGIHAVFPSSPLPPPPSLLWSPRDRLLHCYVHNTPCAMPISRRDVKKKPEGLQRRQYRSGTYAIIQRMLTAFSAGLRKSARVSSPVSPAAPALRPQPSPPHHTRAAHAHSSTRHGRTRAASPNHQARAGPQAQACMKAASHHITPHHTATPAPR